MARLITERVKLDVEIYSDDVVGLEVTRAQIEVTSAGDDGPTYVPGLTRHRVQLSEDAARRIAAALEQAMRDHVEVREAVTEQLRRGRAINLTGDL